MKTKVCIRCKQEYPATTEYFYNHSGCKGGLRPRCKKCIAKTAVVYRKKHTEHRRKYLKDWRNNNPGKRKAQDLRNKYGINIEQYTELLSLQRGVCAICGKPETKIYKRTKSPKMLSVDHDHETNKVRGLLCTNCNLMLGYAQDSVTILQNTISYLLKNKNESETD